MDAGAHELDSTPFVVAVGGSAGALAVMRTLVGGLPAELNAILLVVLHVPANSPGMLPGILSQSGPLPASHPRSGATARPGHIYVAPPDHHLLLDPDPDQRGFRLTLSRGARENRHRPAIDPLFRSVARQAGPRAIAVVLSGMLEDGAAGAAAIKAAGGRVLIQDPATAQSASMPEHALRRAGADAVAAPAQLAAQLQSMLQEMMPVVATATGGATHDGNGWIPTQFSCPECHGVLMRNGADGFRCRTGHAYGWASLAAEYSAEVENALWIAMRTLREKASLAQRMAEHAAPESGRARFEEQARAADQQADSIRAMIEHLTALAEPAATT